MQSNLTREQALALLKTYNKEPFHIQHALTVEGVMRWYANELGYGADADYWATVGLLHDIDFENWPEEHCRKAPELLRAAGVGEDMIHSICSHANELGYGADADYWATVGLLHDIDFENWPEEHCRKAPELLRAAGVGEDMIHSICSHGYGLCSDVEPVHEMEKVLFAADELTGLIGAAALMRPSKSVMDMEVSSVRKKFKDKKFAAGCSRDVIAEGAQRLGWELTDLMDRTLRAMQSLADLG